MPPATISEWTWPEKPWHRLHLDLADNGRQFVSGEFEQFTKMNGIRHTKTSPYNPSTNGLAEGYVKEFKNLLRKNNGKDDLETNLQSFLFAHRAFPQTVIKEFPGGTANEEKFKIKILEFNTKMGNPREVFHEAVRRQEQFTTGCEVYFRNYATGPKRIFQGLISTLQLVERLDRYPLRNKRKIDSVEPEETSMNVKKEGTQRCGDFTMKRKLKQRICIEFCVKLQISATETFEMLNKAFPNDAPKRTTVFEWHSRFKAGRISIEDDPRQGCPKFQRTDENE
ncbi:K02A2.6-like [Cordylochernes scorpioides]|uniref:K02A2.6-like n=1 Tax=Cordylochernes scorpioides TaxID=51811 RepID=A0ABY6KR31_9ARAC|nr:K02A2.6-like [Cordylochernes scorpioides]